MSFPIFSPSAWIIYISFFFAGIIDAICGGGGLLTISAFMTAGFPVRFITGTNQMSCLVGSGVSFLRYAKRGLVYWPIAGIATIFSIIGSYTGAGLAMTKGARLIRPMFIMVLSALTLKILLQLIT